MDDGLIFNSIAKQVNSAFLGAFSGDIDLATFPHHTVFCVCFFSFLMAMFGRIYVFAHHFVDVVVGGSVGLIFPIMLRSYFVTLSTDVHHGAAAEGVPYLYGETCLAWFIIYSVSLATFFLFQKVAFPCNILYCVCKVVFRRIFCCNIFLILCYSFYAVKNFPRSK